jgi:hypothetical protein
MMRTRLIPTFCTLAMLTAAPLLRAQTDARDDAPSTAPTARRGPPRHEHGRQSEERSKRSSSA